MEYILVSGKAYKQTLKFKTLTALYEYVTEAKLIAGEYKVFKVTEIL